MLDQPSAEAPTPWTRVSASPAALYMEWQLDSTKNLTAAEFATRVSDRLEVRADLNRNLNVRNRSSNQFHDATALLEWHLAELSLLRILSTTVARSIWTVGRRYNVARNPVRLVLELRGSHVFNANLTLGDDSFATFEILRPELPATES